MYSPRLEDSPPAKPNFAAPEPEPIPETGVAIAPPQGAPMPPPVAPMAPRGPGFGGVNRALRGMRQVGTDALAGQAAHDQAMQGLAQQQAAGMGAEYGAKAEAAQLGADAYQDYNAKFAAQEAVHAENERGRVQSEEEWSKDLDRSRQAMRYDMDPDEAEQHMAVMNSPSSSAEMRARAKVALRKAEDSAGKDPWTNKSVGRKIGAAIAMGMGAYAAAFTGRNDAKDIIQQQLQREVDAQKQRSRTRTQDYNAKQSLFDRNLQRLGDERLAEKATLHSLTESVQRKIKGIGAQSQSQEITGRGEQLVAGLGLDMEKHAQEGRDAKDQLRLQIANRDVQTQTQKAGIRAQSAAAQAKGQRQPMQIEGLTATGKTTVTREGFKKAQEAKTSMDAASTALDKALELRKQYGTEHFGGPVQTEMAIVRDDLVGTIAELGNAGVMSEAEVERYRDMVGDIGGVGFQTARLEALRDLVNRRGDAALKASGFQRNDERPGNSGAAVY